jgi:hypothetical protein
MHEFVKKNCIIIDSNGATTFSIRTFSTRTLNIKTFSIRTLIITTLSITTLNSERNYAECNSCLVSFRLSVANKPIMLRPYF